MAKRFRPRRLLVLLAVAMSPFLLMGGLRWNARQIPFDPPHWRSGDRVLRYRMKDALRAKFDAGELSTRDGIDAALGPDDDRSVTDAEVRNYSLSTPYLGM